MNAIAITAWQRKILEEGVKGDKLIIPFNTSPIIVENKRNHDQFLEISVKSPRKPKKGLPE